MKSATVLKPKPKPVRSPSQQIIHAETDTELVEAYSHLRGAELELAEMGLEDYQKGLKREADAIG